MECKVWKYFGFIFICYNSLYNFNSSTSFIKILRKFCIYTVVNIKWKLFIHTWYSVKIYSTVKVYVLWKIIFCVKKLYLLWIAQSHYCCIILCMAKPNVTDTLRSITYIDLLIKLASYSIDNDFEGWINKNIQSD